MNKKSFIWIMIFFLVIFALTKFIFSQLCESAQNNPVAQIVSNAISNMQSAPAAPTSSVTPEPLSWEPLLKQLAIFFAKACPR
jgi:ABC-type spermidine/putrescine transport system permease subunit I